MWDSPSATWFNLEKVQQLACRGQTTVVKPKKCPADFLSNPLRESRIVGADKKQQLGNVCQDDQTKNWHEAKPMRNRVARVSAPRCLGKYDRRTQGAAYSAPGVVTC